MACTPQECVLWSYNPCNDTITGLDVINHFVAYCDPPYCHSELAFPNGEACSIVMGKCVQLRKRSFDPTVYTALTISTTADKVQKAHQIAMQFVQDKLAFGLFTPNTTYCSRLVADILLGSGIVADVADVAESEPLRGRLTPSGLHRELARMFTASPDSSLVVQAIAFKSSAVL